MSRRLEQATRSSVERRRLRPASTPSRARAANAAGRWRAQIAGARRRQGFWHTRIAHAREENDLRSRPRSGIAVLSGLPRSEPK